MRKQWVSCNWLALFAFTWNAENQMTELNIFASAVDTVPTSFAKYIYDGLGRRVAKNVDNVITKYLYDNEDILLELDDNDNVLARYTHGPGIDEPLIMERNGQTYYYITDGLGSVVKLVDATGTVVNNYVYDSFGNIISKTEGVTNSYTYTGREYDSESGLYYYRARYYDASVGRFMSEDPIGFFGGVNFFNYPNNPVNLLDPFGLAPSDLFKTQDAAAIDALDFIRIRSKIEKKEYGGFIYRRKDFYSYTPAVSGKEKTMDVSSFNKTPEGAVTTAIYHTHVGTGYSVKWFSTYDYLVSSYYGYDIYLGTESCHIKVWNPIKAKERIVR